MQYPNFYSFTYPIPPNGFLRALHSTFCSGRMPIAWLIVLFFLGSHQLSLGQEFPCEENSLLVTPCYVAGNPTDPTFVFGDEAAIVAFPYNSSTTTIPTAQPDADRSMRVMATAGEVGAVWGVAHQRSNSLIFASSVLKRHAGYGPLGSGGIYVIQVDENQSGGSVNTALSFRMDDLTLGNGSGTILTADPSLTTNSQRGLPANGFTDSRDANSFSGVGKTSLGDIDISEDEATLWVSNLYDRSLYEIPIGAPMESRPETAFKYTLPDESLRPWAVKVRLGKVYVGAVDPTDLVATVWVFDIASKTWETTPLITVDLQYNRGNINSIITPGSTTSANWNDWADTWAEMNPPTPSGVDDRPEFGHPQPILSDIEFGDGGRLVLGFLDRGGMQLGVISVAPDPNVEGLYTGDAAGDILVAQSNAADQYILEENGTINAEGKNIPGDVAQNPGDAEFISEDFYARSGAAFDVIHEEVALGGLAYLESSNEIVSIAYDPLSIADVPGLDAIDNFDLEDAFEFSGGTSWFSLEDGSKQRAFMVFSQLDYERTISFGKASGLGDIELFCSAPRVLCATTTGALSPVPFDIVENCYDGSNCVEISAEVSEAPAEVEGYSVLYVLSATDSLVINEVSSSPSFCAEGSGLFTIHTLVYDSTKLDLSGIVFGETLAQDILDLAAASDSCTQLDVAGASFVIDTCVVDVVDSCITDAGSLSPRAFPDSVEGCYDGENCVEIAADINVEPVTDSGYSIVYVLTAGDGLVIQETGAEPLFCVEDTGKFTIHTLVYDPTKLDLSGIVPGETTGGDVLELIAVNDTCAKLDVAGAMFQIDTCTTPPPPPLVDSCITDAGSLSPRAFPDSVEGCYDGENCVEIAADINVEPVTDSGYSIVYVLTAGDGLVIQETGAEPLFCVEDTGKFTIHTLVYDSTKLDLSGIVPGETTGGDVLELIAVNDTCAKLDVAGAMFQIDTCTTPPPPPPVDSCITDAGSLSPRAFPDSVEGCYDGENCVEIAADINVEPVTDSGYSVVYVLTAGDGLVIQETGAEPLFCVEDTGKFTIHTLVYDSTKLDLSGIVPGETTGGDVLELIAVNDTCAKLDVAGAMFQIDTCTTPPPPPPVDSCITDAGSLSPRAFPDSVEGCYDGENCVEIAADINVEAVTDSGYSIVYVLTAGDGLVIQETGAEPLFCVEDTGKFTIHTLVYDSTKLDLSGIVPGETTGGDVLELIAVNDTCAKLDVAGAMFQIDTCTTPPPPPPADSCITDAGRISPRTFPDSVETCYDGENCVVIIADIELAPTLDSGYTATFVLTAGDALIVQETNFDPIFCVEDTGKFTIHTLVYDSTKLDLSAIVPGETTGGDVLELIAVSDTCAKLDVAGAMFQIDTCTTPPPPPPADSCITDAGSLNPRAFPDSLAGCYDGENCVELVAEIETAAILDSGYSILYVLTSGDELVIQGTGNEPVFCVEETGKFTIHTLVYDPTKLDLSGVVPGETTGGDVLELIAVNDTCAKLDVVGAMFMVEDCGACPRDAKPDAGTLVANPDTCFDGANPVMISAELAEAPFIPEGYVLTYVLTQGEELLITGTSNDPSFMVGAAGKFTIHTLVYDTLTIDLNPFLLDVSPAATLLGALDSICADLDVTGAMFDIDTCTVDPCIDVEISAGTLIGTLDSCYKDAPVKIMAEHGEEPIVPEGYVLVYALTVGSDLVVAAVDTVPMFMVEAPGTYRIHSFVFDSTDFDIDLSSLDLGVSTAADVLALGGDSICSALDVEGALFEIEPCVNEVCPDSLNISAGSLEAVSDSCYDGSTPVMLVAEHGMEPMIPDGYSSVYVLTQGTDLTIIDTDSIPSFTVEGLGRFTIHTLVYDPSTLDLGIVEPGSTTAAQVLGVLGDSICAALDAVGAPFDIFPCTVDSTCEDIKDYILSSWGADRNANFDHSVFLFHSPADPDRMMLGDRDFNQFFWESNGTLRVYLDESGAVKDTASITGIIASEVDPSLRLEVSLILVNPMTWEEHSAMGGGYKANLYSTDVADTAHVNWTYWEISDASKLIGLGALDGLVFDVSHAPSDRVYKLQVGYGANDKDGSLGLSGWFGYTGEFNGVSYSAQGDINVDIETCIETEVCEPIISNSVGSWVIRDVTATAIYDADPRVQISWSAFSSNAASTTYSIDKSEDGGKFYETVETMRAAADAFKYSYTDEAVKGHASYVYRIRVVMEGEPVTTTADLKVSLDRVFLKVNPNPAERLLQLSASNPHIGSYRLELLNSQGQVVGMEQVEDLVKPVDLDISDLSAGFYFIRVTTPGEGVQMLRFVKQ